MERPFGIQIFGGREEAMHGAAKVAEAANPDLVDINFGCPVYKVVSKNAGSACLRDLGMMERMAGTVVDAVENKPVTVKTRLGWDENTIRIQGGSTHAAVRWGQGPHRSRPYPPARLQGPGPLGVFKLLKNTPGLHIPIIANGDITTAEHVKYLFDETGVDGVMIGRAAIGNPWIFRDVKHFFSTRGATCPGHHCRIG